MTVGHSLLKGTRHGQLINTAQSLGVSERTLRNWREEAKQGAPKRRMGRPGHTHDDHRQAMWKVGREWRRQGYPGWRAVTAGLTKSVPVRLVQLYVKRFKHSREQRRRARILFHQVRVEVLTRDVIWGQDATHVGRELDKSTAIESQVIRDRGSLSVIGLHTDKTADHMDVIALLKTTALNRDGYPLVYGRDNGSIYHHAEVLAHLESEQVIVLRSLPRTPQHNGATECAIRELKQVSGLGKGCKLQITDAKSEMEAAAAALNKNRPRSSKDLKTAAELDEKLARPETTERARFYKVCRLRMAAALLGQKSVRAGRLAEREEVFRTLEEFGFIKRTRGGNPYVSKSEIIL